MSSTGVLRLLAATFGFSALAFVASIAGDLATADPAPASGRTVVLRLPPPQAALAAEPAGEAGGAEAEHAATVDDPPSTEPF